MNDSNNLEDSTGHFSRILIPLMKLYSNKDRIVNFSEIENCCLERYKFEKECLKDRKAENE